MTPTTLGTRSSRIVWRWCIAYTSLAPRELRERRRTELADHLHESERAGHRSRAVLGAAVAGAPDDLGWTLRLGAQRLLRWFLTPVPYVVVAAIAPLQAAFAWSRASAHTQNLAHASGALGGAAALVVAAGVYALRRHR